MYYHCPKEQRHLRIVEDFRAERLPAAYLMFGSKLPVRGNIYILHPTHRYLPSVDGRNFYNLLPYISSLAFTTSCNGAYLLSTDGDTIHEMERRNSNYQCPMSITCYCFIIRRAAFVSRFHLARRIRNEMTKMERGSVVGDEIVGGDEGVRGR